MMSYADGVILTGGPDVPNIFYSKEIPTSPVYSDSNYLRSFIEYTMIHAGKPVLGICRGAQIINTYFGGTLKNVQGQFGKQELSITNNESGRLFKNEIGPSIYGFSAHHQAVDQLGKDLEIAIELQNIVKAFVNKAKTIFGTQFHPERYLHDWFVDRLPNKKIFQLFLESMKKKK